MSDFRKAPPAPPEANLGNITPFRPDRRRQVCGLLKSLSILGLVCFLIYSVWNYHEQLSLTNLRRMASYLSGGWSGGGAGTEGFSLLFESDSVYCAFGDGLAAVAGDTLSFVNAQGQEQLRAQLKYSNPALSAAADNLLAYDRGGKSLCLTNRYAALWQIELESDIISASVNYNGAFSVVTDEQGYRAAVTLYDNRKKTRFKWSTSEYYIMKSCVSPDARRLAALCMSEDGGRRVSAVRVFSTDREEPLFDIPLGDLTVYSMEYYEQDSLMVVTDRGVFSYDEAGRERGRFEYSQGSAVTFCHEMGRLPCLALETGDKNQRSRAVVVDENGGLVFDRYYAEAARDISYGGDYVALLLRDKVEQASVLAGGGEASCQEINARALLQREDGGVVLIYADRAELLYLN